MVKALFAQLTNICKRTISRQSLKKVVKFGSDNGFREEHCITIFVLKIDHSGIQLQNYNEHKNSRIYIQMYIYMYVTEQFSIWWLSTSHLFNELEVKDTQKYASYLELHFEIDNGGSLKTNLYDKCDDITIPIVNFPLISSNILESSACGVCISHLIHYSKACTQHSDFLDRARVLIQKLPKTRLHCS